MEFHTCIYVDIGDSVSISHKKRLIRIQIWSNPFDTAASKRVQPRINNSNLPVFGMSLLNNFPALIGEVERHVTSIKKIMSKEIFDDFLLVARANYEFRMAKMSIPFHNMPKNRHSTDFNHRLRLELGLLTNASPVTTC